MIKPARARIMNEIIGKSMRYIGMAGILIGLFLFILDRLPTSWSIAVFVFSCFFCIAGREIADISKNGIDE